MCAMKYNLVIAFLTLSSNIPLYVLNLCSGSKILQKELLRVSFQIEARRNVAMFLMRFEEIVQHLNAYHRDVTNESFPSSQHRCEKLGFLFSNGK